MLALSDLRNTTKNLDHHVLLKSKIEKRREREDECNEVLTLLSQLDRPTTIQENQKFWRESIRGNLARVQDLECVTRNIIQNGIFYV